MDSAAVEIDGSVMEGVSIPAFSGRGAAAPAANGSGRCSRRYRNRHRPGLTRSLLPAGRTDPQSLRGAQLHHRLRREDHEDPRRPERAGAQVS